MKKIFLVTALLFWAIIEISAQCTNCNGTTNTGNTSSAIGKNTVSKGLTSFASGFGSQATESYTTALGFYTFATYNKATAIGSTVKATGYQSIVLGSGDYNTGTYLINNIPRSLMIGFHSLYPTLFVVGDDTPNGFNKTGRIGIGNVTNPQAKLHIKADEGEEAAVFVEPNSWEAGSKKAYLYLGTKSTGISNDFSAGLVYHTATKHTFNGGDVFIPENSLGIGTDNTYGYALAVKGKILTDEVMVKHPDDWYDYVFNSNYKLQSIKELEKYIKQNKHLPDIPSGKEVKDSGIALAKMNGLLLKKIEELTLYIIQQQTILNKQQQRLSALEQKIESNKK